MNPKQGTGSASSVPTGQVGTRGWAGRSRLLIAVGLVAVVTILLLPRIPQNPAYHRFADWRTWLEVANFLNVASNLPFLIVGLMGLAFIANPQALADRHAFLDQRERWPYGIFFLGVALTSFGSAYYHLAPANDRLVWDRLPMTIAITAFVAAIIAERINVRTGLALLVPLLFAGASSAFYWHFTEQAGAGDLRPYVLVQFYPLVAIPLMMYLYPPRYTRSLDVARALGFYALAKLFEVLDVQILQLGGIVSGHTLKHLAAALAPFWILRMLMRRELVARACP